MKTRDCLNVNDFVNYLRIRSYPHVFYAINLSNLLLIYDFRMNECRFFTQ